MTHRLVRPVINFYIFTNNGPFPILDGLSEWPGLAYFKNHAVRARIYGPPMEPGYMTETTPSGPNGHRPPAISFEFFPPKTEDMERSLWEAIKRLAPLAPNFVSVTYGAGGSTRERTHSTIARILAETRLTPAAHLTCAAAPCAAVDDVAAPYHEVGARHIVALRGDPASGLGGTYAPHPQGYRSSA